MAGHEQHSAGRRLSRWLLKHRRSVLIIGIVLFVASLPFAALAQSYINYSSVGSSPSGDQSAEVQSLLASANPQFSTLYIVVPNTSTETQFCQSSFHFNQTIASKDISHYNYTDSICSSVGSIINSLYGPNASLIRTSYTEFGNLSSQIYDYPATFLTAWGTHAYARDEINATYNETGGMPGYDNAFRSSLYQNYSSDVLPNTQVDQAVAANAYAYHTSNQTLVILGLGATVTDYSTPSLLASETALWLLFHGIFLTPSIVTAFVTPGDPGWNFVLVNGYSRVLSVIPGGPLIRSQYVSPDNSTLLVRISFNVPDTYRGPHNFYPAEAATPEIRDLANQFYGAGAGVTGSGAITYDTSALSSTSDVLFAFTFLFLVIAVLVTLRSLWAPVLIVVFVILGFLVGYTAIFITGVLLGSVSYLVTYVLEAVTLGIVADYLVFVLYRYREELRQGTSPEEAIQRSTETAGVAVLTSASIVAVGLAILSLIPGFESWGLVLFLAVMG
ncbi:MAG: MMPL family transporter, partial [Thermoplasmata archaeon]